MGQEVIPINVPEEGVPLWVECPQTCHCFTLLGSPRNFLCPKAPLLHPSPLWGSALFPEGAPRPTCTSAASPAPPPMRWLGFRFRNCRTRMEGKGLGERR